MPRQPKKTIQERFEFFNNAYPDVFSMILREARRAKAKGKTRFGIRAIIETIRWQEFLKSQSTDMFAATGGYKINDHFISRYARLLVEKYPEFAGCVELRELKAP